MTALRYAPRHVFLPLPLPEQRDLVDALRGAGHHVYFGTIGAFLASDTVVVTAPPSTSGYFYAGAAEASRKLLFALGDAGADLGPVGGLGYLRARAHSIGELLDLLRRWDPVRLDFDPPSRGGA